MPPLSSPLSSRQGEKGKVSLGVREKTQRPKPLVPAELEELLSRSPSFRSVSDFFFPFVDTSRCSLSATDNSFGWQKKKRGKEDGGKKINIYLLNSFSFAIPDAPPFLQEEKIKIIK